MVQIQCRIGCLNAGLLPGPLATPEFAQFVADHFAAASGGDIALDVVFYDAFVPPLGPGEPATALDLHHALMFLTGNPVNQPTSTVGVLLASSYAPFHHALGVMFDRGFPTLDDPNTGPFAAVPREGCAVFLDSIAKLRDPSGADPDAAIQETVFTAVHEIGHLFNLWHMPAQFPTFMSSSRADAPFDEGAFRFAPIHSQWLSNCSTDMRVHPGGSPFLDQGGSFNTGGPKTRRRAHPHLQLTIAVSPRRCLHFEPIHLDMTLRVRGQHKRILIPANFDPAHESFRIFIESPTGERRLFRSTLHCCASTATIEIGQKQPYRRDIPIFCDLRGYTFNVPGVHRVRVEVEIGRAYIVRSNTVELRILRASARSSGERRLGRLAEQEIRTALLFGKDGARAVAPNALLDLVKTWKPPFSERESLVAYLAGRTLVACGHSRAGIRFLEKVVKHGALGAHRRARAGQFIEQSRRPRD